MKKSGRPKKITARTKQIAFRVSQAEYTEIMEWAAKYGVEAGTEIRRIVLERARLVFA